MANDEHRPEDEEGGAHDRDNDRDRDRDRDWVEALLRADRAMAVRDDGLVERLLTQLPARRKSRRGWITPLMTCVGTILAVLSLGGPAATLSELQMEVGGVIPLALLLAFGVLLIGYVWAISEVTQPAQPPVLTRLSGAGTAGQTQEPYASASPPAASG